MLSDVRRDARRGLLGDGVQRLLGCAFAALAEDLQAEDGEDQKRKDPARRDQRGEEQRHAPAGHCAPSQSGSVSRISYGPSLGFLMRTSKTAALSRVQMNAAGGSSRRACAAPAQSWASRARSTTGFE